MTVRESADHCKWNVSSSDGTALETSRTVGARFRVPYALLPGLSAFEDTWHWNDSAEETFDAVMKSGATDAAEMLRAIRAFLKENDMMAYLSMSGCSPLELHRTLKPTGSAYLHCDRTASNYLKILLDAIFSPENFRTEIVWKRSTSHGNVSRGFGDLTDSILYYSKTSKFLWNQQYTTAKISLERL